MDKLYWLDQIKPQDHPKVGDKAFHLSRMMQRGYPVLPGFVVSAEVLRDFLENLNSSEALIADLPHSSLHLDVDNWRQLQQVAGRLRQEIITASIPEQLFSKILKAALRLLPSKDAQSHSPKSGEASFQNNVFFIFRPTVAVPTAKYGTKNISGLLESQFSSSDEQAIALALKRTWSQLFRAKSLLYWQRIGIDLQQVNLGVLVQPVYNAIASGLVNANSTGLEIQATWGLGMAISKGEVLPDVYYIEPQNNAVQERQLGNKILAYRLNNTRPGAIAQHLPEIQPNQTGLVSYPLEEAQQNQYALPEEHLQQLIDLSNQLVQEVGPHFTLEWTICDEPTRTLYFTQISSYQNAISNFQLVKGLGVAGGRVMASAHVIVDSRPQQQEQIPFGVILVGREIAPDWLPLLQQAGGIVTEHGGLTSHAAILARELGIPAVVGVPDATIIFQSGEQLIVDGDHGVVYRVTRGAEEHRSRGALEQGGRGAGEILEQGYRAPVTSAGKPSKKIASMESLLNSSESSIRGNSRELINSPTWLQNQQSPQIISDGKVPLESQAGEHKDESNEQKNYGQKYTGSKSQNSWPIIATQLLVNLSQPRLIEQVRNLSVDGVGLIRSELMVLNILEGQHPNIWLQEGRKAELLERWCNLIMEFAAGFAPRPIFYRSLDWRSHELLSFSQGLKSSTPGALGERGTFSYIENPAIFELELAAVAAVQKAGYSNIRLVLPFVRSVEEFSFCRQKIEQAMLTLIPQFQVWIMAEVPSILFLLPEYVKAGVQGISIGTNDLTQLLLGVDRDQGNLTTVFNERHPAVTKAIAQLIEMANSAGIPCSICGQAPALYPEIIEQLVQWGITSISVEPEAIERTIRAIARAEQKLLLQAARKQINHRTLD
ncbi:PEP-utilizing enzyme [Aetokthonos hydrillicola Thurmond2011]|uniref:Phosphoenolpyruvate synthase n=1 Tax=Aetokthonos hydrillicola Thurmond2011 TaxID=2712845 RepID=A0AAP5IE09_9CYAN|nr:putative PEP-binding protein [Aetokthonos hydrillicola]MBO3459206.1 phosphoenolpyruvate synthase [Aetokthonos hydrillicola CCALA 1050]MBW4584165.1 phosphoenolpyruvate synthase [Aetokthonos hydrillicola CCALA 1050]MDR9898302.1 PEP-utilizing enzyme [Aetokthonos hydrillicola Thurmond2011]